MGRIMGIDFGIKKSGIAVTDPFQLIVNGLATVETVELQSFLKDYFEKEIVEKVVIGQSFHADGKPTEHESRIAVLIKFLTRAFPDLIIDRQDESFTSEMAKKILYESGMPKMKRRDKSQVDKLSAVLILQQYLGHI